MNHVRFLLAMMILYGAALSTPWAATIPKSRSSRSVAILSTASSKQAAFDAPRWSLTLEAVEQAALQHSPTLAASRFDRRSAEKTADALETTLLPQLSLNGSATYIDKLPELSVLPGHPPMILGDHKNWSAGINAAWTVWDWGALRSAWKSAGANAEARTEAERLTRRQIILAARSAYLQVRLAREQVRLLADSLDLAQSQQHDVESRVSAGTAGQLDLSSARQETLARRRNLREARASLAGALRDLTDLTGEAPPADPSLPIDQATASQPPAGIDAPTLIFAMEDETKVQTRLSVPVDHSDFSDQPQVKQWESVAEASRRQASSAKAGLLPKIQLSGSAVYEYPNQSDLKTIQQNTAMVSASMPLFDWGREWKQASAARAQAEAAEARKAQAQADWDRDTQKAQDQYSALKDEANLDAQAATEADDFAKLVRESYRAGRSTYLEVESADLKALQAQVSYARTSVQVLLQAAILRSLTTDETKD